MQETAENTATTAIQTISEETFAQVIQRAPEALTLNQTSVSKAKQAGQTLLDTIEGNDMSDALDERCNKYQLQVKKTIEIMQDRRKPVTQILTEISKMFTSLEAELDPKRPDSIFAKVQNHRNKYAQQKLEIQKQKEREAQRKLQIEKEKADITSRITISLNDYFNNHLTESVAYLNSLFNSIALSNHILVKQEIESFSDTYLYNHYKAFNPSFRDRSAMYNTPEQVEVIIANVVNVNSSFNLFAEKYKQTISEQKMSILDRIPSKLELLNQIAVQERMAKEEAERLKKLQEQASAEEAERLARESAIRQELAKEEAERLKAIQEKARQEEDRKAAEEAKQRQATAELQAESTKQAEQMQTLFDVTAEIQAPATTAKEAYQIEVLNNAGWMLIFQFYFEKEGLKETTEKLEKKTLGQMKAFCEKYALKNDELIKSLYLVYHEVAKATVKR